jgi:8-oxo-dGTP diphosphatase
MKERSIRTIRIAAALIDDHSGRLLLVRKAGTQWFMQAGGKIEDGESALSALRRELHEEIGLAFAADLALPLGTFWASAANEPNHIVEAEVFHIRVSHDPVTRSEIEEAVWVSAAEAVTMPLAPLTREHILPLSLTLSSPA